MINLGLGVAWTFGKINRFVSNMILAFRARVYADGGVFEAPGCLAAQLEELRKDQLLSSASFLVTPNAVEENKLFAIVPSSGAGDLDVVRATTATLVNSAGLIESAPYNLLQRSEEFNNAAWVNTNCVVTANSVIAPNGTLTADLINLIDSTSRLTQTLALGAGTYTLSLYAKNEGGTGTCRLRATVDGSVVTLLNFEPTATWQRFEITFTANSSITDVNFRSTNAVGNFSFWGAQLVTGTSAKEYFPTTDRLDVPRLGYTNSSCPSILVEPQRTNLALRSQELDSALVWFPVAATVSANNTTAPDGTVSADKVIATAATSTHIILQQPSGSVNGTTSTVSIFAKAAGLSRIQLVNNAGGFGVADYNLSTGTATLVSGVSASIQDYGNGWYRCIMTYTPTNTGNFNIQIRLADSSGNTTFLGNGVDGVSLWGAQIELGSNATSYIPTIASTVTRNADVISKTGISSLIGQTEGTLFVDVNYEAEGISKAYLNLGTSTSSYIAISATTLNKIAMEVLNSSVQVNASSTSTYSVNQRLKIAMAYKANDFKLYINGILQATDTSGTVPAKAEVYLGSYGNGTLQAMDGINLAALWKTALTDAQLELLTGSSFYTYDEMAIALNYNIQ
jgi:hypothetical protein